MLLLMMMLLMRMIDDVVAVENGESKSLRGIAMVEVDVGDVG